MKKKKTAKKPTLILTPKPKPTIYFTPKPPSKMVPGRYTKKSKAK